MIDWPSLTLPPINLYNAPRAPAQSVVASVPAPKTTAVAKSVALQLAARISPASTTREGVDVQ